MNQNQTARPHLVGTAVKLLYVALGIGVLQTIIKVSMHAEMTLSSFIALGIVWFLIFMIGKGRNWARITFLVLFIISTADVALPLMQGLIVNPIPVLIRVAQKIINLVALVFLFQKPSSDWFRQLKATKMPNKSMKFYSIFLLAAILFGSITASALDEKSLTPELQNFFDEFKKTAENNNLDRVHKLTHPLSFKCYSSGNSEFYKRIYSIYVGRFSEIVKIQSVTFIDIDKEDFIKQSNSEKWNWPVIPEKQIFVRYSLKEGGGILALHVAKDGENWKWVHICDQ